MIVKSTLQGSMGGKGKEREGQGSALEEEIRAKSKRILLRGLRDKIFGKYRRNESIGEETAGEKEST